MNEPPANDEKGKESDFSEYAGARARVPPRDTTSRAGAFLRGCGIAVVIAFVVLLLVVGTCFVAY